MVNIYVLHVSIRVKKKDFYV